MTKQKSKTA